MLTIREPIKLNITDALTTVTDAFYERVVGNYNMMSASITPKDLLFYLSTPPEIPDDLGGMTTVAVQNSLTDKRSVSMDIINNVVNRILLSTSSDFTYQDQVYIDNILNKLGVTNVSVFMKQVQNLSEEHTAIRELISLYSQELSLRGPVSKPLDERKQISGTSGSKEESDRQPLPPLFLHNEIYRRLETGAIYDIVNAYQSEQAHNFGTFHNNELKVSEQLFVSQLLKLSSLKERAVAGGTLTLTHISNHFELGDILPPPQDEAEVLSQASAAALLSTVEHTIVQKLHRGGGDNYLWLSLEQSLNETIGNALSRFQSFHNENYASYPSNRIDAENTIAQYKGEARVLHELIELRRRLGDISLSLRSEDNSFSASSSLFLTHTTEDLTDNSVNYGESITDLSSNRTGYETPDTIREQVIRDKRYELESIIKPDSASHLEAPPFSPISIEYPSADSTELLSPENTLLLEKQKATIFNRQLTEKTREILKREQPGGKVKPTPPEASAVSEILENKTVREIELEYDILEHSRLLEKLVHRAVPEAVSVFSDTQAVPSQEPGSPLSVSNFIEQKLVTGGNSLSQNINIDESRRTTTYSRQTGEEPDAAGTAAESSFDEAVRQKASLFPVSDSDADPQLLEREISELDRRNREIFESLKLTQIEKTVEHIPVLDREKTLNMSLRALSSPEDVLRELLNSPSSSVPPAAGLKSEAEAYLKKADAQTRELYEAILRYEQNPQGAQKDKLFHVGSIGEFNSVAAVHAQAQANSIQSERDALRLDRELLTEKQETVLEQFGELPSKRQVISKEPSVPPKVPIVHKFEQTDFSEELLQKLEQQKTQQSTTQVLTEEVTNRQVQEITQNEIKTQLITQSAEDITKLVNQTLAKQMNAISDKVYQQMEKRLSTERSRRGRF